MAIRDGFFLLSLKKRSLHRANIYCVYLRGYTTFTSVGSYFIRISHVILLKIIPTLFLKIFLFSVENFSELLAIVRWLMSMHIFPATLLVISRNKLSRKCDRQKFLFHIEQVVKYLFKGTIFPSAISSFSVIWFSCIEIGSTGFFLKIGKFFNS